jgi:1-aminocyclopropane-1-carboxylate deaminase
MKNSALEEIASPKAGIRLFMKRDDLLHPEIQGNKWRKLRALVQKLEQEKTGVLSFGGPFSNHLHALASAGKLYGFPTIGIVRGLAADLSNPTLAFAQQCGMQLFPVTKVAYEVLKTATMPAIFEHIGYIPTASYQMLAEGGDTVEALVSCAEIPGEIMEQLPKDVAAPYYFCVPAGTGCTAAGLVAGANEGHVLIFPAAPYGVDRELIQGKIRMAGFEQKVGFDIVEGEGKFARVSEELRDFVQAFSQKTNILLDPIYTSKMMQRLFGMLEQGYFPKGSCVVALHTGGLQGWGKSKGKQF